MRLSIRTLRILQRYDNGALRGKRVPTENCVLVLYSLRIYRAMLGWGDLLGNVTSLAPRGVGVVFIVAATSKFIRFDQFMASVLSYRIVSSVCCAFVLSMMIVFVEVLIGTLLIAAWQPWASAAGFGLLLGFTCVIAVTRFRHSPPRDCGCFQFGRTHGTQPVGWHVCVRNLILIAFLSPQLVHCPPEWMVIIVAGLTTACAAVYGVEKHRSKSTASA